jgi:hypothetical protein
MSAMSKEDVSARSARLTTYIGLAGVGALATGGVAQADVVVTGSTPVTLTAGVDSQFQITFRAEFNDSLATWYGSTARFSGANVQFIRRSGAGAVARWGSGKTIGSSAGAGQSSILLDTNHAWSVVQANPRPILFMNSSGNVMGAYAWQDAGDTGFVGIRFADGADYYYGWVQITKNNDANADFTIDAWYVSDTANQAVIAGSTAPPAVPGIGGLAALACGAAGVRRRRTRLA